MATSEARVLANRQNAQLSTGPRTTEGKAKSRRNGLKHGMTGVGIALPDEDQDDVLDRFEGFHADLQPKTQLGGFLVHRLAFLSVRIQRCERQESKAITIRMRNAPGDFDEARMTEVENLIQTIGLSPPTNARRLRTMPEGIDRLIREMSGLMLDLVHPTKPRWDEARAQKLDNLMGRLLVDSPLSIVGAWSRALSGDSSDLMPGDSEGLTVEDQKAWALENLIQIIDKQVDALRALRETIDTDLIDQDRAESSTRAIFDPSKEATLARRYEASADRLFFKTLDELREVEEAAKTQAPIEEATIEVAEIIEPLGSSCQEVEDLGDEPSPIDPPTSAEWDRYYGRALSAPNREKSAAPAAKSSELSLSR